MDSGSAQASGQAWQGDRLLRAVLDRLGRSATIALLVSPIGVLFVSAARLLIISDYNTATASAIVSSGGYVDALLGTVLPLIPLVLPYLALLLLFFNRVIPGLLALLATALISPTTAASERLVDRSWANVGGNAGAVILLVLLGLVFALFLLVTLLSAGFGTVMRILGGVLCVVLIPTFVELYPLPVANSYYTQLLRQPWLPAETFTLSTGQRFTGYELADDGTSIEILNDASRTITYYRVSEIIDRQICELGPVQAKQPLITLSSARTGTGASLPACATAQAAAPSGPVPHATVNGGAD